MKKQNIEDIFSSMENFSSVPPPELWDNIEEKLHQPKKKKSAVIWWSIAASLLVGLSIPSVLYFNSGNEIQNNNNSNLNNNSVVLEENKNGLDKDKTRTSSIEEVTPQGLKNDTAKSIKDELNSSDKNHKQEIQTADSNKNQNTILDLKPGVQKSNTNQAVAEKSFVTGKANKFNTALENQNIGNKNRNTNQNTTEKTIVTTQQNTFNSLAENQNNSNKKRNKNQNTTEKTIAATQQNAFNSLAENQNNSNKKRNKNETTGEKKVVFGKKNQFSPTLKSQVANSVFDDKTISKNSNNVAYNILNSDSNDQNWIENKTKETNKNENSIAENSAVNIQKNNSDFNSNVLSKQDSVQLAELQNLEKGIITPEKKDEKEKKSDLIKDGKWAVSVFAGVASSENYKNEKTLGNVNDSKQTSTYGVKTKYKINKKWAVGSGFKINELGQSVANVSYMSVKNTAFFTSGDYYLVQNSPTSQIGSNSDYLLIPSNTKEVLKSDNIQSGNLDQNLRYIEMPLEVSYSVFNKNKASININTGGFVGRLISNNVTLDGTSIGENINANDFVYGSTLSSTLQYRVYKKTNVFVEPAVNYYINPLTSQSFNQFQWGLNFGLNVSF